MILAVTAVTNFILACEVFFLAGMLAKTTKTFYSAAWFWSVAFFLLGISALLGAIDHGFLEPAGLPVRIPLKRLNWIVLGGSTFCILMTTTRQFMPSKFFKAIFVIGMAQFVLYIVLFLLVNRFIVVILNYAPVFILLLIASFIGLKDGSGSWSIIAGVIILLIASVIQTTDIVLFSAVDEDGLYHLITMISVGFLYVGGQRLNRTV